MFFRIGTRILDTDTFTDADIIEPGEELSPHGERRDATGDGKANLVVFSGPQLSLYELKTLAELLEGRRVADGTSLIVTTNSAYKHAGERLGYLRTIEDAGGLILEGVCFYILDGVARLRAENGWNNLVTNSAKLANIIAAHRYNPILRPTEECVEVAITGELRN